MLAPGPGLRSLTRAEQTEFALTRNRPGPELDNKYNRL